MISRSKSPCNANLYSNSNSNTKMKNSYNDKNVNSAIKSQINIRNNYTPNTPQSNNNLYSNSHNNYTHNLNISKYNNKKTPTSNNNNSVNNNLLITSKNNINSCNTNTCNNNLVKNNNYESSQKKIKYNQPINNNHINNYNQIQNTKIVKNNIKNEDSLEFIDPMNKHHQVRSKTPVERERRPKSNINENYNDIYKNYDKIDYLPKESDSTRIPIYTKYSKIRENNFSNSINQNTQNTQNSNQDENYTFDKTFGKISEMSDKLKMMHNNKINYQSENNNLEINKYTQNNIQNNIQNNYKRDLINSYSSNNINNKKQTEISKSNLTKTNSLEKNDSFSLMKTQNSNYMTSNFPTDSIHFNKESTSDSLKSKMTNSSISPISHLEEVKAMFQKMDPEEIHFVSINLIQSSKIVVRMHEHVIDKEDLFSTVTKCDEKDI